MRTNDISNTIEDVQRTARVVTPRAAAFTAQPVQQPVSAPVQSAFPASGPQRIGPPSGPQPLPPPPPSFAAPPPRPAAAKRSNKPWYIATAVIAVVVVAVVTVLVVTSGDGGGGTADSCASNEPDDQGFSECMRKLAGSVPEHNECQEGAVNPLNSDSLEAPNTTSATCTMADDHTVIYMHFGSSDSQGGQENAQEYVDTFNQQFEALSGSTGEQNSGGWDGDGLAGSYTSIEAGGVGLLIFSMEDSPVLGVLIRADVTATGGSPISDFYDEHVKPGSDGGA